MQRLWINIEGQIEELFLPPGAEEVMPGVIWGPPDELFTPSFWKYQSEAQIYRNRYSSHRLGDTLLEEIAVCLLGGYGIPAEMGLAAFERLKDHEVLQGTATETQMFQLLSEPFNMAGRLRQYRFAAQKARYLSRALGMAKNLEFKPPGAPASGPITRIPRNWSEDRVMDCAKSLEFRRGRYHRRPSSSRLRHDESV